MAYCLLMGENNNKMTLVKIKEMIALTSMIIYLTMTCIKKCIHYNAILNYNVIDELSLYVPHNDLFMLFMSTLRFKK